MRRIFLLLIILGTICLVSTQIHAGDIIKRHPVPLVKTPLKAADISKFTWQAGQPGVVMLPVSEGLCALTGVAGKFRGGGEQVSVTQAGGYWLLGGSTMQGYLWAQAHCIKYKDLGANFSDIRYVSTSGWLGCESTCTQDVVAFYYDGFGYKAGFLQGISGDMEHPSLWNTPLVFAGLVHRKSGDYTDSGLGVAVGGRGIKSSGGNDVFTTMRGKIGVIKGQNVPDMRNEYAIQYKQAAFTTSQNTDIKTNYHADSYFCTMRSVSGYFHGGGERVNLAIDSSGEWIMQGQTFQTQSNMSAWCFKYK